MNSVLLWGEAVAKGYAAPIWMTYKQAQEIGVAAAHAQRAADYLYALQPAEETAVA